MESIEDTADDGKKAFQVLFLAVFIDLLGFGIIIPILPFLAQDINPANEGVILASLLSIYSIAQFIFSPLWGRFSDRIGRRPVILIGLFGSSIAFTIFALVSSYPLLMLSRAVAGMFTAATLPTSRAYIADITPPEERARRFGLLGAAFGLGFTFGPAIGSFLSIDFFLISGLPNHAFASLFAAALTLGNYLLARRRIPETIDPITSEQTLREPMKENIRNFLQFFTIAGVTILIVIFGITTLVFSGFEAMFPLFANAVDSSLNEDNIGYFFALIGILVAIAQSTMVGPTVKRLGEERTILLALCLQAFGFFILTLATGIFSLIVYVIPIGIGTALANPSINSAISNRIPQDQQGGGLGLNSSVGSLGRVVGPLFAGFLYDNISPESPFSIGAGIILFVFLLGLILLRQQKSN